MLNEKTVTVEVDGHTLTGTAYFYGDDYECDGVTIDQRTTAPGGFIESNRSKIERVITVAARNVLKARDAAKVDRGYEVHDDEEDSMVGSDFDSIWDDEDEEDDDSDYSDYTEFYEGSE